MLIEAWGASADVRHRAWDLCWVSPALSKSYASESSEESAAAGAEAWLGAEAWRGAAEEEEEVR